MKISDGLKRFLPRTHYDGFSTAAFQNDFEEFSRVCIIIYCDYLDVSKFSFRNPFFFFKVVLCRLFGARIGFGGYGSQLDLDHGPATWARALSANRTTVQLDEM